MDFKDHEITEAVRVKEPQEGVQPIEPSTVYS